MTGKHILLVYSDYKSPYAYLAKAEIRALADIAGVVVEWRPYVLDIPQYLGSARVDAAGRVLEEDRNPHQWRRVRYSYMDCRRQARKQGLVIRGTRKIWDSSLAAAGMVFAQHRGEEVFRRYHDAVFDRFWRHDLDIESPEAIADALGRAGADPAPFAAWLPEGLDEVRRLCREAEASGVFGVPTFVLDGEIWWGREHLPDIRDRLRAPP